MNHVKSDTELICLASELIDATVQQGSLVTETVNLLTKLTSLVRELIGLVSKQPRLTAQNPAKTSELTGKSCRPCLGWAELPPGHPLRFLCLCLCAASLIGSSADPRQQFRRADEHELAVDWCADLPNGNATALRNS
jgi:hypothetical protein